MIIISACVFFAWIHHIYFHPQVAAIAIRDRSAEEILCARDPVSSAAGWIAPAAYSRTRVRDAIQPAAEDTGLGVPLPEGGKGE